MIKKNLQSYLAIRRERFEKLCADYRRIISEAERDYGQRNLCERLGKSQNYLRECKRGGIVGLKKCAEEILSVIEDSKL